MLFVEATIILRHPGGALCILSHRILKRYIFKDQDLTKSIILMLYQGHFKVKLAFLLLIY